jgi:hypothetical protein
MARRRDRRVAALLEELGHAIHERGIEEGLVALHVDDDVAVGEPQACGGLGEPVGAGRMVLARHADLDAMALARIAHHRVVGGDHDAGGRALHRTLGHPHDHRLARDVGERLARQPRRGIAGRDEHGEHRDSPL